MQVDRVTGRVEGGPLEDIYVYEAPVRLWHWVTMLCIMTLAPTGYLIGAPLPALAGEPTFMFFLGWVRMIHMTAGWILAVAFLVRIYWAFVGNKSSRALFIVPFWSGRWWAGFFGDIRYYLFLKKHGDLWVGHNPLAQFAMFSMFMLGVVVLILTGFALFAQQYPWGTTWMNLFGWVTVLLGEPQAVRTVHHFAMWYMLLFAMIHTYMVFREDITRGSTVISTMINGIRMFKREPHA
jgi:Ni/Fe-hydrogenase 1 B-type cytochrome subunit